MTANRNQLTYDTAVRDFRRARKAAAMQQLMAKLQGKSADLLAYDDVCQHVDASDSQDKGVQEIPLDAIVGSVGRFKDFTRDFLPKNDSDEERWAGVKTAVMDMKGMPPIDVYKTDDVYFVIDGNHRVSIARQLGAKTITAHVIEIKTRIPITPEDDANELLCKARYADFLEETSLDKLRPDANLYLTFCGKFRVLQEQIARYRQTVEQRVNRPVTDEEAVTRWYDEVYLPVLRIIREQGIMRNFPRLTEADMYILVSERQEELVERLGWHVDLETAAPEITEQVKEKRRNIFSRVGGRLRDALIPPDFEDGPPPGEWRKMQEVRHRDVLFSDYLVSLPGRDSDWHMLDIAIKSAKRDNDRLLGLHVVADKSQVNSAKVQAIREGFSRRCEAAGLVGEFAVEVGNVVDVIVRRAVWADLVVVSLKHPPGGQPLERLGNRFNRLIQQCPRSILAVPEWAEPGTDRMMLGYDGSPKAKEALFVATYLASRWPKDVTVVTVETEHTPAETLQEARAYLEKHGVYNARYILKQKPIADAILDTAVKYNVNFLIIGGFGFRPVMQVVLGSSVDRILREFRHPVLICR
ncbi:MAG: universal stress protein [Chloroflexi bacterium]|nr:universal stress protein [Chloroflexota bacterium]